MILLHISREQGVYAPSRLREEAKKQEHFKKTVRIFISRNNLFVKAENSSKLLLRRY